MAEKKQTQPKNKKATKYNLQKLLKNPVTFLVFAGLLLILLGGFLAIPKYSEFVEMKADLSKIINEIEGNNQSGNFLGLKGELKKVQAEYAESKKTLDALNAEKQLILDKAFPAEENINYLTSLLESYAIDKDSADEPFELTTISFSKPKAPSTSKPKPGEKPKAAAPIGYATMQINLPIKVSEKNFEEFIEFIHASGSLDQADFYNQEKTVPLMTIESLNFTYAENPDKPSQQLVNANFVLNTYIQSNVSTSK